MEHRYLQSREERQQADKNEPIKKFDAQKQDTTPSKWEETAEHVRKQEIAHYNGNISPSGMIALTKAKDQAVLQGQIDILEGLLKVQLYKVVDTNRINAKLAELKEAQRDITR